MSEYKAPVLLIIVIAVGILIAPFGMIKPVRDTVVTIFSPMSIGLLKIGDGIRTFKVTLFSLEDVMKDNENLRKNNLKLDAENAKLHEVEHENNILRSELKFQKESKLQLIAAKVSAKSATGYVDEIVINKGSRDGVEENAAVISNGFLVGRVRSVSANSANILLITSNASSIPTLLQESRGTGLVKGGLSGLRMDNIPLDTKIRDNETVVTSDLGGLLPKGIPVGQIDKVSSSLSDMMQLASIKTPVEMNKLEMVFIVKDTI